MSRRVFEYTCTSIGAKVCKIFDKSKWFTGKVREKKFFSNFFFLIFSESWDYLSRLSPITHYPTPYLEIGVLPLPLVSGEAHYFSQSLDKPMLS